MNSLMHFSEPLLRAVSELELRTRRNVSAFLSGNYRSRFRGSGMQFKEFRHYEPGDDIRHMAWPVTARTGRATVKVYEEDRELNVVMLVDTSGSTIFAGKQKRKQEMYAELVALVGLAAVKSGDRMGSLFFDDEPLDFLPPRRTRANVLASLSKLLDRPLTGKRSDLRPALTYLHNILPTRSMILILSDFMVPAFENEFMRLARTHEVILLHGYDDAERGIGLKGVYEVCDPETGEFYILDGRSKRVRRHLAEHQFALSRQLQDLAERSKADYLPLSVEDDYLQRFVRFFRQRGPVRI